MSLMWRNSWRYIMRHPVQCLLAILGVALGVAVVVAVDLASGSARRAFALSSESITGKATDQIVGGPQGLEPTVYQQIRQLDGVVAAPIVELPARVAANPGAAYRILGIDPFAEAPFRPYLVPQGNQNSLDGFITQPGSVLIPVSLSSTAGITIGQALPVEIQGITQTLTVSGIIEAQDDLSRRALSDLLVVDISTATELANRGSRIDRIDLILPEAQRTQLQEVIRQQLPSDATLTTPAARSASLEQLTRAFDVNLQALSLLALLVGTFLIYNTMTFSVVQRRTLFGTLRTLGVTRSEVFQLILGEAILIGGLGAVIGVAAGVALGRGLVQLVTQTINDLYFSVNVNSLELTPWPLVKGLILGIGATLAAACVPAIEATFAPPRTVQRRSSVEQRLQRIVPRLALAGGLLIAASLGVMFIPSRNLPLSLSSMFGVVIGCALLTPSITMLLMRLLHPLLQRAFGLLGQMAARDVVNALSRTGVAIAALMVAVAVTVGAGTMIGSFRQTVIDWLGATLRADVYISAPGFNATRATTPLREDVVADILRTPGIESYSTAINLDVDSPYGSTALSAIVAPPEPHRQQSLQFLSDADAGWQGFDQGGVLISEPYAYRTGLQVGDQLALQTEQGLIEFPIAGIYADYASERGIVSMNRDTFDRYWNEDELSSIGIWAEPNLDTDVLLERLQTAAGSRQALKIQANRDLREGTLVIFDRTFAITTVLQLLATIVAFIGILSALMALQLERARELGVLRAVGLTPRQLWALVISQTGLMGLVAGILALPVGMLLAYVLVFVINKRSFGWTLQLQFAPALFIQALALALLAALLAGIYPAWRMARSSPALALREE